VKLRLTCSRSAYQREGTNWLTASRPDVGPRHHELATNATKHGALSSAEGRVAVTWLLDNDTPVLRFRWHERGGPPVVPPERVGFGRTIIENLVSQEFGNKPRIDYAPGGLTYELDIDVSKLEKGS
jgi:two-component sensor histidine kinase